MDVQAQAQSFSLLHQWARWYVTALGLRVFPLPCERKAAAIVGIRSATDDLAQIDAWWLANPNANIGVVGCLRVDIDPRHGGDIAWNALVAQHGDIRTLTARTPSGGAHLYLRTSTMYGNGTGALPADIDIRGHNSGYTVAPPSVTTDIPGQQVAGAYQWVDVSVPIADAPQWLLDMLAAPANRHALSAQPAIVGGKIGEGERNTYLSGEAFRQKKQGASVEQIVDVLRAINDARCDPSLDDAEVRQIAYGKAHVAPDPSPSSVGFGRSPLPAGVSPVPLVPSPPVLRGPSVELVCAADIQPEPIRWLWDGWLARGKLAVLAGVAGTGKSTVAFGLAAVVTTGGGWPDGTRCEAVGNVVIWSAEDDPADTIISRLMAAGADLTRVHIVRGKKSPDGQSLPFDPAHDVPELHRQMERTGGVALLIVDPIVSAVAGDMNKANDVRRSLQPLVDFGAKFGCAVVGISHFSKGSKGTSPQERVIGSQAFGALARIVLVCAKNEEDDTRVLARAKSNISVDTGGFNYSIVTTTLASGIATRIEWGEAVEGSALAILQDVEGNPEVQGGHGDDCSHALSMTLRDAQGRPVEMTRKEVVTKLKAEGFTEKMIRTAREHLGVKSRREGFGQNMKSSWRLPDDPLDPQVVFASPQPLPPGAIPIPVVPPPPTAPGRISVAPPFVPLPPFLPSQPDRAPMGSEGMNGAQLSSPDGDL